MCPFTIQKQVKDILRVVPKNVVIVGGRITFRVGKENLIIKERDIRNLRHILQQPRHAMAKVN